MTFNAYRYNFEWLRIVFVMVVVCGASALRTGQRVWPWNTASPNRYLNFTMSLGSFGKFSFEAAYIFTVFLFAVFGLVVSPKYGFVFFPALVLFAIGLPAYRLAVLSCVLIVAFLAPASSCGVSISVKFRQWLNYLAFGAGFCLNCLRHSVSLVKTMFTPRAAQSACGFFIVHPHRCYARRI